jgi:hypothetical protein
MLEKVPLDVASRHWLYMVAKPPCAGIDVDGLSYPLHHPTAFRCQTRVQSPWSGAALPYLVTRLLSREPLPMRDHLL